MSLNLSCLARQLRLRDMGGIIVVDFIDLLTPENRKTLFDHFKKEMESDRAKHKILPPSKIGRFYLEVKSYVLLYQIPFPF